MYSTILSRPTLSNDSLCIGNMRIDHFYISLPHVPNPSKTGALVEVVRNNTASKTLHELINLNWKEYYIKHLQSITVRSQLQNKLRILQASYLWTETHCNLGSPLWIRFSVFWYINHI